MDPTTHDPEMCEISKHSMVCGGASSPRASCSFGATTLRMRHAEVKGQVLRLRFRAKSGKDREMQVTDRGLVRFVKKMQDLPGQRGRVGLVDG